jgi:hypothetical protein
MATSALPIPEKTEIPPVIVPKQKSTRTSFQERAKGFAAGTASGLTKLVVGHPWVFLHDLQRSRLNFLGDTALIDLIRERACPLRVIKPRSSLT